MEAVLSGIPRTYWALYLQVHKDGRSWDSIPPYEGTEEICTSCRAEILQKTVQQNRTQHFHLKGKRGRGRERIASHQERGHAEFFEMTEGDKIQP